MQAYKGSPISKGQFQFDLWRDFPTVVDPMAKAKSPHRKHEDVEEEVDETEKRRGRPKKQVDTNSPHSGRWDWEKLRKEIKKHGVRNSLVTALMPTASTSQIMGSIAEAFEPITNNCYTRRVKAGEFILLNTYLANDLIKLGLWNSDMRNVLLDSRGSVQDIKWIPQKLKDVYKTVWEIKQSVLITHSITRGIYVDQSQSLNLYFAGGDYDLITKAHFFGWAGGLKTGSYYIRTLPAANAASFSKEDKDDEHAEKDPSPQASPTTRVSPPKRSPLKTKDDEDCEMCGS